MMMKPLKASCMSKNKEVHTYYVILILKLREKKEQIPTYIKSAWKKKENTDYTIFSMFSVTKRGKSKAHFPVRKQWNYDDYDVFLLMACCRHGIVLLLVVNL
uniref:Uncharacterized protein n=1 Tax=Cacopsylla melanoneura TaxID=428564 RepID=A0A8D8ZPQ1_9HEMI